MIDVRPSDGSSYIRSSTEPFDQEMRLDEKRVIGWLKHFGLVTSQKQWNHTHVSGHGDGTQIKEVIDGAKSKKVVPIHTVNEKYHKKWHRDVKTIKLNGTIEL